MGPWIPRLADIVAATLILGGALLVGGWLLLSARRRTGSGQGSGRGIREHLERPQRGPVAMKPKDLEELANRILVETDDAIRDSDQELGFAQAQFGDDAAAPFVAAIAGAKDDIKGAFTIRQRLDDETPEDAPTHRQMLIDLVVACRKAQDRLHAETHRFDELRALEKEAPGILAGLPAKADALEARLPAAQAALTALGSYADADWQAVASNVDNARTRIAAVREAVVEGTKALAGGTPGIAAHAVPAGRGRARPGNGLPRRDRSPRCRPREGPLGGGCGARHGRGRARQGEDGRRQPVLRTRTSPNASRRRISSSSTRARRSIHRNPT